MQCNKNFLFFKSFDLNKQTFLFTFALNAISMHSSFNSIARLFICWVNNCVIQSYNTWINVTNCAGYVNILLIFQTLSECSFSHIKTILFISLNFVMGYFEESISMFFQFKRKNFLIFFCSLQILIIEYNIISCDIIVNNNVNKKKKHKKNINK